VLAAALHLARRDDLPRAVLLAGYALSAPAQLKKKPVPVLLQVHQQVRDRALAEHSAAAVETWLRTGERLTEAQVAAIAFDNVPLDGLL
jgi:hypothetical protein